MDVYLHHSKPGIIEVPDIFFFLKLGIIRPARLGISVSWEAKLDKLY